MDQDIHRRLFIICHFVRNYTHTLIAKGCIRTLYQKTTALLLEISVFWVRTVCEIWYVSYESKQARQPLLTFMPTYTCNLKTTGRIWMLYILNDCCTIEDFYFLCLSWMQDAIGELWLQTLIAVLSDKPFVGAYMHNLKTTGYIWTLSKLNECSTIRHTPCVV